MVYRFFHLLVEVGPYLAFVYLYDACRIVLGHGLPPSYWSLVGALNQYEETMVTFQKANLHTKGYVIQRFCLNDTVE